MRRFVIVMFVLMASPAVFAEEKPTQPVDIEQLLQDLRDLDSSTDMRGDHVVGEGLC